MLNKSNLYQRNSYFYTGLGYIAIILWSSLPLMSVSVTSIPIFEILTIAFSISFLLSVIRLSIRKDWCKVGRPSLLWIIGILGIFGNEAFFISAFKYAPANQVTLIFYIWPLFVFVGSYFFLNEKLKARHIIASIVCLISLYFALVSDNNNNFNISHTKGYLLALLSASVWSMYTIAARYYVKQSCELVGMYFGFSAVLSGMMHYYLEPTIVPSFFQLAIIVIMGLTTQGIAYYFWDIGVKKGNYNSLYLVSFCNPLISLGILIFFQMSEFSIIFLISSCMLVLSNLTLRVKN